MSYLFALALFAPIVFFALRQKRWYLYLSAALVSVLPEQFSIRLHEGLPLLTASRLLIVMLLGFWIADRIRQRKFSPPLSLLLYGGAMILISLINLRYGSREINRLFLFAFERVLVILMLRDLIKTRQELMTCLDFLIMGAMVLAVMGITQTVFDYDISQALRLQFTPSSLFISDRMGMTRAYAVLNAISYGCYCAFVTLPICYRIKQECRWWHNAALALNTAALICTYSRSAWLSIAGVFLVAAILYRKKLLKPLWRGGVVTLALTLCLCAAQPKLMGGLVETGKSAFNTVLRVLPFVTVDPDDSPDPDLSQPGFELDDEFGENADNPTASRMMQWTAVEKMTLDGQAAFGYGYEALARGKIQFHYVNWGNDWVTTTFLDVGLVTLLTESGFAGGLVHVCLLALVLLTAWRQKRKNKQLHGGFDFYTVAMLTVPLYLLLYFLASFLFHPVFWVFLGLFYAYRKLDAQGLLCDQAETDAPAPDEAAAQVPTGRVAVLLSTYQGEPYLRAQLDSILAQQCSLPIEIFVRDDGSCDATQDILREYEAQGKLHWFTGDNLRPARSFLQLLQQTEGYDYYAFADQDDVWHPDKLQAAVARLQGVSRPALYFANARLVDAAGQPLGRNVYRQTPYRDFQTLSVAGGLLGCTMVFNGALARLVQQSPPPRAVVMHDFYLALLCDLADGAMLYDATPRLDYRQHGKNAVGVSKSKRQAIAERLHTVTKPSAVSVAEQAESLLTCLPESHNTQKRRWLQRVADYRGSFGSALRLACSRRTQYTNSNKSVTLRLALLLRNR